MLKGEAKNHNSFHLVDLKKTRFHLNRTSRFELHFILYK